MEVAVRATFAEVSKEVRRRQQTCWSGVNSALPTFLVGCAPLQAHNIHSNSSGKRDCAARPKLARAAQPFLRILLPSTATVPSSDDLRSSGTTFRHDELRRSSCRQEELVPPAP